MKIPKAVQVSDSKFPKHLRDFHAAMTLLDPTIHKLVLAVGHHDIFTTRTHKRGENLFLGGNVVQVVAEEEPLGVWRLIFKVWALV